jgi:cobalamin biosynthesis protein CobD/CbiB
MKRYFGGGTIFVIIVTGLIFIVALFVKGFTHELLLEAGVLLVSIKLIMMAHRSNLNYEELKNELHEIKALLKEK